MSTHRSRKLVCLLLGMAAACSSPERRLEPSPEQPRQAAGPVPWTDAFAKPAVLIAADVRIEGPRGLLGHVATVSDPADFVRSEKTLPEGFLQEILVKPDAAGAEIKAQLDLLTIVATDRLVILERPGPVDVLVLATGDAYWASRENEEKRGESLRFHGKIAR